MKRRCLHLHIGYPEAKLEERIVHTRLPQVEAQLLRQIVSFVQQLRHMDLRKLPSVSETLDWARALLLLHASYLDVDIVRDTLNVLLKFEQDMEAVGKQVLEFVEKAKAEAAL